MTTNEFISYIDTGPQTSDSDLHLLLSIVAQTPFRQSGINYVEDLVAWLRSIAGDDHRAIKALEQKLGIHHGRIAAHPGWL
jgi:hypothetical protein